MPLGTRSSRRAGRAALDFGLRVRLETHPEQGAIFAGARDLSCERLAEELSLMVSELRVRSFALRAELEEVAVALLENLRCGFQPQARRAALDLGGLLSLARRRRLADPDLCVRGENCANRIAALCGAEVR
jgi:hypothetical protein